MLIVIFETQATLQQYYKNVAFATLLLKCAREKYDWIQILPALACF
ncbi:MAG: hypothetical protein ETSY2_47660 [Candidatus Entotheonella gemina]|uniref:Uncharacterized protein n=1 Tax=Candidatus Entotheonella gemina TaxID=1429439 RepID=W4LCB9_9BACT|nr:MAG: hypothetical protein ETSY2_47660 [Candidatus Entotheonella gemina]